MNGQVTTYQCPSCTAPLAYDAATGKLACEFCGSSYEVAQMEALMAEKEKQAVEASEQAASIEAVWDTSGMSSEWGTDAAGMKTYSCPSCGAELVCDATTAASSCPYCGNPTIVQGQFSGMLKPDFVIPFKVTKEEAIAKLKEHYKGKFFLPKRFSDENSIREIKGVYVPFWMFDGQAEGYASYDATRVDVYTLGDTEYTDTYHYDVSRSGIIRFEKIPVDASSKMDDRYMDSIEPFDYSALMPFSTAYMPGYLADKYDVTVEQCAERADARAKQTVSDALLREASIGYTSCIPRNESIELQRGQVHYALLPVWMLSTEWNGERYMFAVNGQTGKTVGDLPVNKGKVAKTFAAVAAAVAAIGCAIVALL